MIFKPKLVQSWLLAQPCQRRGHEKEVVVCALAGQCWHWTRAQFIYTLIRDRCCSLRGFSFAEMCFSSITELFKIIIISNFRVGQNSVKNILKERATSRIKARAKGRKKCAGTCCGMFFSKESKGVNTAFSCLVPLA